MDIIVATVSENCLVMVMLVFDVPYQRGALDVKKKKKAQLLDWVEEAASDIEHSAAATFALTAARFVCECGRFSWIFMMQSVFWCVSVCTRACVLACMWLEVVRSVSENVVCMNLWEREHQPLLKVWLRHSHSLHHQSALWCLSASPRTPTASLLLLPPQLHCQNASLRGRQFHSSAPTEARNS